MFHEFKSINHDTATLEENDITVEESIQTAAPLSTRLTRLRDGGLGSVESHLRKPYSHMFMKILLWA